MNTAATQTTVIAEYDGQERTFTGSCLKAALNTADNALYGYGSYETATGRTLDLLDSGEIEVHETGPQPRRVFFRLEDGTPVAVYTFNPRRDVRMLATGVGPNSYGPIQAPVALPRRKFYGGFHRAYWGG
jgi:hypothetical protein